MPRHTFTREHGHTPIVTEADRQLAAAWANGQAQSVRGTTAMANGGKMSPESDYMNAEMRRGAKFHTFVTDMDDHVLEVDGVPVQVQPK